jgi:sugar phosphate isomerase/epimerase
MAYLPNITRRGFLRTSTLAGFAAAAAGYGLPVAARALTPLERKGSPRLRISMDSFSFRERFALDQVPADLKQKFGRPDPAKRTYDHNQFVDYCVRLGLDGVQLTSYIFPTQATDYLIKLKRYCQVHGVSVSGIGSTCNASLPPGAARDAEIVKFKKVIDQGVLLGTGFVRGFIGQSDVPRAQGDKYAISFLEECGEYAGERGIFIGINNHDVTTIPRLLPIIKTIKSPWVAIDIGSSSANATDEQLIECMPYSINILLHSEVRGPNGLELVNYRHWAKLLRAGGYQGWVVIKYEGSKAAEEPLERGLAAMREAFAAG